jgi:hypothetical protein
MRVLLQISQSFTVRKIEAEDVVKIWDNPPPPSTKDCPNDRCIGADLRSLKTLIIPQTRFDQWDGVQQHRNSGIRIFLKSPTNGNELTRDD